MKEAISTGHKTNEKKEKEQKMNRMENRKCFSSHKNFGVITIYWTKRGARRKENK